MSTSVLVLALASQELSHRPLGVTTFVQQAVATLFLTSDTLLILCGMVKDVRGPMFAVVSTLLHGSVRSYLNLPPMT